DVSGLDALRRLFWAKSFMARQERLARKLLAAGRSAAELAGMRLGDLDGSDPDLQKYLARRTRLSLGTGPEEPFVVYPNGHSVGPHRLVPYLGRCRLVAVSIAAN